jgi:hypothetical protein
VVACIGCLLKLLLQGIKLHMEEVCWKDQCMQGKRNKATHGRSLLKDQCMQDKKIIDHTM